MAEEEKKEETTEEASAEEAVEEKKEEAPAEEPKEEVKEEAPAEEAKEEEVELSAEMEELAKKYEKLIGEIEKLSVVELAELVQVLEKKFGVSAAAPVAAAGGGGEAEEKDSFNIMLKASGDQKINVIKAVREITGLGLKESKDIVEGAPQMIKEGVKTEEANEFKAKLEEAGATVELQ